MATGLLPLTFGEATKFSQMLLDADKEYEAVVQLGVETDSGDADGAIIATAPVDVTVDAVLRAMAKLTGEIEQIPPMYSALKRDGKPLYEYARAGIELERDPRCVSVHAFELLDLSESSLRVRVACSKGTYVRTLAIDLGRLLGCGAHLTGLRRTRIGVFGLDSGVVTLAALESAEPEARDDFLATADALVKGFPRVDLDRAQGDFLLQGRVLAAPQGSVGLVRVYGEGRFLGLAQCEEDGRMLPKRLIHSSALMHQVG
jgi:tRNA pseudouridine55 synthase